MFCKAFTYIMLLFLLLNKIKIKAKYSPNLCLTGIGFENGDNTIQKLIEALARCKEEIFIPVSFRDTYQFHPAFYPNRYYANIKNDNEPKHSLVSEN